MVEINKEEIRAEAKAILDKFASALEKVKIGKKEKKKEAGGYRKEGAGKEHDDAFRKIMFDNAPKKDDNCIIAEKKSW